MFIIVLANRRRGGRRVETVEQRVGRDTRRMIDGSGGGYEDGRALPTHIAILQVKIRGVTSQFSIINNNLQTIIL